MTDIKQHNPRLFHVSQYQEDGLIFINAHDVLGRSIALRNGFNRDELWQIKTEIELWFDTHQLGIGT